MGSQGQGKMRTWDILEELAQLPCKAFYKTVQLHCSLLVIEKIAVWCLKTGEKIPIGHESWQKTSAECFWGLAPKIGCLGFLFSLRMGCALLQRKMKHPTATWADEGAVVWNQQEKRSAEVRCYRFFFFYLVVLVLRSKLIHALKEKKNQKTKHKTNQFPI